MAKAYGLERARKRIVIPFLLPALLLYTVIFFYPILRALWVSLHQWSGFGEPMKFIGLHNFRRMLGESIFWESLVRTLSITFFGGIGVFAISMFFGILYQSSFKGIRTFRAIMFFPMIIPGIGVGIMWSFIYNVGWGPLSALLKLAGLQALDRVWLSPDYFMGSIIVMIIWVFAGYYITLLLAGLDKLPQSFYEVARIDGASEFQVFFRITLPMIRDVMMTAIILWIISSLKTFDLIVAITFPTPPVSSYTLTVYIWQMAMGTFEPVFNLGYATALGVVLLLLVLAGFTVTRLIARRETIEY